MVARQHDASASKCKTCHSPTRKRRGISISSSLSIARIPYSILLYIPPPNMPPPPPPCFPCASPCIFSLTLTLTSKNLDTQRSRQTDSPLLRSASRYDVSMHLDVQDLTRLEQWKLVNACFLKRLRGGLGESDEHTGCTCRKPCRFPLRPVQSFAPKRFGVFDRRTLTSWVVVGGCFLSRVGERGA